MKLKTNKLKKEKSPNPKMILSFYKNFLESVPSFQKFN